MKYALKAAALAIPLAFTASPAFADRYELKKFQMAYQMAVALRRDMGQIGKDHYMKQDGRIRHIVDEAYKACIDDVKVDIKAKTTT